MAGAASCRVHRPTSGIGLDEIAQACIGAARKIEGVVKFWEGTPRMELLKDREPDEAYLAAKPGERYTLLFADGGCVGLDLQGHAGEFHIKWVDIASGEWGHRLR
jgi:hypothetical protein